MAEEDAKNPKGEEASAPDAASDKAENLAGQPSDDPAESDRANQVANPTAGEAGTPDVAQAHASRTDEPVATDLPSAGKPDAEPTGPEQEPKAGSAKLDKPAPEPEANKPDSEEKAKPAAARADKPPREKAAAKASGDGDSPPARAAKKEKPPAVEDKPFPEFITQEYLPNLQKMLAKQGIEGVDLKFEKQKLPIRGVDDTDCWQVIGKLRADKHLFIIGFMKEDISGPKFFCAADYGAKPSILESFMIDERRVTLDLLLLYTIQRLNGQKWLNTAVSRN
ncbi:DUF2996 domain-containing protein [Oculatella sp. LEGE 06141]|uniref:DUF2996 domain-containing protein n=1 Tax=Oculatella sp. LEGE 06141 TaxID=1828648 RepID=UPI00187E0573|nr:DUF2996 domain-containing protein [Oculatella sp. LEGE 06141]MBE9179204.1 DUF2996 domain-containing protein [Oculatella sp. LEGE 06141]